MAALPSGARAEIRGTLTRESGDGNTVPQTGYATLYPQLIPGTLYHATGVDSIASTGVDLPIVNGRLRDPNNTAEWPEALRSDAPGHSHPGMQYRLEWHLDNMLKQPPPTVFTLGAGGIDVRSIVDTTPQPAVVIVVSEQTRIDAEEAAAEAHRFADEAREHRDFLAAPAEDQMAVYIGTRTLPPSTGSAAADTAMLQDALDLAPAGSVLVLRAQRYLLNAPLILSRGVELRGQWVRETLQSYAGSLPDMPRQSPHLTGSVLVQTAPGVDAIQVREGASSRFRDFGILFEGSHRFINTGHGINVIPNTDAAKRYLNGTSFVGWEHLKVFGHDGNHYAYNVVNPMHGTITDVRSWGGGVMRVAAQGTHFNYGNLVITAAYGYVFCGGTAHAYECSSDITTVSDGKLNFVTFIRPQANVVQELALNPTPPTADQYLWKMTSLVTGAVRDITVISPDLEASSGAAHKAQFLEYVTVILGGYLPRGTQYQVRQRYNPNDPPAVAVNSGQTGGTGAAAAFAGGNNPDTLAGVVRLTMGSGTPNALAELCKVTFPALLFRSPKYVRLTNLDNKADPGFYPQNSSVSGFEIRARNAPASNGTYLVGWEVVE